jgi:uncharacterized protein YjfI (DUF2170 family)
MNVMTEQQIKDYQAAAELGLIPDSENPLFIFSQTHGDLLVEIAGGGIDIIKLAQFELRCRGQNDKGKFVGFNKAKHEPS